MKFLTAKSSVAVLLLTAGMGTAQDWTQSKYGAGDMAGASNLMTAAKALEAAELIRRGRVISIGRDYTADMPLFGDRVFALRGTRGLAGGPLGANQVIWMDDFIATEIGQVGTQFDGLAHIGVGGDAHMFYNGTPAGEVFGGAGAAKLGIEHVKPFFTRGILLDIATLRGGPMEAGDEITAADLEAALQRQGLEPPGSGDVVLLHTGWGRHWITDNTTFNSGEPGIGLDAARWLIERDIAVIGADTWAIEVLPNPDSTVAFPVHMELIPKNGIFIHENIATERLIDAEIFEFAYIFSPVPIAGATGSIGAPLAAF